MARITYGTFITEINGSIGGTTFQRNQYGFTGRNKSSITRILSENQRRTRSILALVTQAWLTIGQSNRDAWIAWAISHPVPTKHSPLSVLSGFNYFVKYNCIRLITGTTILQTPNPGVISLPLITPTISLVGGALYLNTHPTIDYYDGFANYFLSPAQKVTKGYNIGVTRYIISDTVRIYNFDITSFYLSVFGSLPQVGDTIFFEFQPWGASIPYILSSQFFKLVVNNSL